MHSDAGEQPRAASVVVIDRGRVLMVLRSRQPFAGLWSFPGGRAHRGEDPEATARRELGEETGLTVATALWLGSFNRRPTSRR